MSQRGLVARWVAAAATLSVAVLAVSAVLHLRDIHNGGLAVVLAGRGCPGFADAPTSAADCSRTMWLYGHWWAPSLVFLLLSVTVGLFVALLRTTTRRRPPSSWDLSSAARPNQ
jgi:hypothetical protein